VENLHASNRLVIGFSYVVVILFSTLFLFRIVRIRGRRKVHIRYLICDEFLVHLLATYVVPYQQSVHVKN